MDFKVGDTPFIQISYTGNGFECATFKVRIDMLSHDGTRALVTFSPENDYYKNEVRFVETRFLSHKKKPARSKEDFKIGDMIVHTVSGVTSMGPVVKINPSTLNYMDFETKTIRRASLKCTMVISRSSEAK